MKIGSLDTKAMGLTQTSEAKTGADATVAGIASSKPTEPSAKVALSATSLAGGVEGDFDAEKVERIARAIREGQFKVNAEAIADKLLAHTGELMSRQVQ